MPSSGTGQNNYYAARHRRPSQQSYGSLPDPVEGQRDSTTRSLAYLPATTYSQPNAGRTNQLSGSNHDRMPALSSSGIQRSTNEYEEPSSDPHDFYRPSQDRFRETSTSGHDEDPESVNSQEQTISQEYPRRRTSSTSKFSPPALFDASKSTPSLSGHLRTRKASFRDLVAKFDSSNGDEIPAVPSRPASRVTSRNVSPNITNRAPSFGHEVDRSNSSIQSKATPGSLSHQREPHLGSRTGIPQPDTNLNISIPSRRPLFGEILPGPAALSKAGYGIQNARRRRGSEGSPMHSPNPMFPADLTPVTSGLSPISPTAWYTGMSLDRPVTNSGLTLPLARPAAHRRSQSDFHERQRSIRTEENSLQSPTIVSTNIGNDQDPSQPEPKRMSQSRIPISSRRYSLTSESGRSSPSSRAASILGKHPTGRVMSSHPNASQPKSASKRTSPKRIQQTLTPIKSPGQRGHGHSVSQSEKSPSLRANIIAPPPKISPPLRSSRPRIPISAASTSASRAKMAEKFTTMQKQNSERRQHPKKPQRPPELNDVDLRARRLRITQALTRSRQGLDMQNGDSTSRRASSNVNLSDSDTLKPMSPVTETNAHNTSPSLLPSVIVDGADVEEDGEQEGFHTPVDQLNEGMRPLDSHTHPANAPDSHQEPVDIESPTMGASDHHRQHLLIPIATHGYQRDSEPCSAITTSTLDAEATPIEVEPQSEFDRPRPLGRTVLSQIMRMRSHSPTTPRSFSSSHSGDAASDRGDDESVQIVLRNTAYMNEQSESHDTYPTQTEYERSDEGTGSAEEHRNSWTSSIQERSPDDGVFGVRTDETQHAQQEHQHSADHAFLRRNHSQLISDHVTDLGSIRSTTASDAYTIVNFVLQQHSTSRVVDDDLADHIYQKVIRQEPQFTHQGTLDAERFEQLCVDELQNFEDQRQSAMEATDWDQNADPRNSNATIRTGRRPSGEREELLEGVTSSPSKGAAHIPINRPSYLTHRQKASLDSAEDFADTSPSIASWMQFATHDSRPTSHLNEVIDAEHDDTLQEDDNTETADTLLPVPRSEDAKTFYVEHDAPFPDLTDLTGPPPRPPSKSPPPPPTGNAPFYSHSASHGYSGHSLSNITTPTTLPPQVPRRVTSLSRMTTQSSLERKESMQSLTEAEETYGGRPSMENQSLQSSSLRSSPTPEQRKLKQRRHVLKELIDTEARFEKDMKVLCDIYKETAYPTLSQDDIKVLFGNSDQVLRFVIDFLSLLKQAAKPAYVIDRSERFQNSKIQGEHQRQISDATSFSTARNSSSGQANDVDDGEKDRLTRIGEAFEESLPKMAIVYSEYLQNHDAANKKLILLQRHSLVREWLSECKKGSADLTAAWDLDSLMVKPVQRITKYPLLLGQLIEATPTDHPDLQALKNALLKLTDIAMRINDAKKHTELVDQAIKRGRKESDVRNGLSNGFTKALGRRSEKFKQHVGFSEMFEDRDYNSLKHDYIENYGHLVVVSRDVQMYKGAITGWVNRMCDLGLAADAWVDVGHTRHTEAESKLRQFAMLVRSISTIALPDHLNDVQKKVIDPMEKAWKYLETLASDPKGLLQKRDKRLIDYARFKNMKDRGEKLDKKTIERIEQWEALNTEAKDRMRKLLVLTSKLINAAQHSFIGILMSWLDMCNRKFSSAMAISLDRLQSGDIEKDWQIEYDYHHATAMTLGICNGSLLAEAVNMVSFLTTPASTMNGDESPRPSWNGENKRTTSLNSDSNNALPLDFNKRNSGSFMTSPLGASIGDSGQYAYGPGRLRAASALSGQVPRTSDVSNRNVSLSAHATMSTTSGRPGTSPGRSTEPSPRLPRLSIDTPSPSFGPLRLDSPVGRPGSSSTFFSATGTPSQNPYQANGRGSGVFSSAMPMADSPMSTQPLPFEDPGRQYAVLFTAASVYEFNIDRSRREAGFPYLTYVAGEIFDVIAERGELWLARNQDDPQRQIGWIWNKHFAKLAE